MTINDVLYHIRQTDGRPFHVAYVRSTGKVGSVGSGVYLFDGYIDTNVDIIKVRDAETKVLKTLKISHLISYNKKAIIHK